MAYTQVIALVLACSSLASSSAVNTVHVPVATPAYQYSYGVSDATTGDQKIAGETRYGGVTKGSYSLVQPDGIVRTVNYIADSVNGFRAQVLNDGVDVTARQGIRTIGAIMARRVIAAAPAAVVAEAPAAVVTAAPAVHNPWAYARWTGPQWLGQAGQETPEVAALRAAHLVAHAQARARNTLGAAASLLSGPHETPEVAAARVAHLAAVAEARARNAGVAIPVAAPAPWSGAAWALNPWAGARWTGPQWLGPAGQETPEVAALRAAHLAAHAEARQRNTLGAAAALLGGPHETPEVSAARIAHLAAVDEARARNAAALGLTIWSGLGWSD